MGLGPVRTRDRAALLRPHAARRRSQCRARRGRSRRHVAAASDLRDVRPNVFALRIRERACSRSLRACARSPDATDRSRGSGLRLAPAHGASVRGVPLRRRGGRGSLVLARPLAAHCRPGFCRRASCGAAFAQRRPPVRPLRARSRPAPRRRHLRGRGDAARARRRSGRPRCRTGRLRTARRSRPVDARAAQARGRRAGGRHHHRSAARPRDRERCGTDHGSARTSASHLHASDLDRARCDRGASCWGTLSTDGMRRCPRCGRRGCGSCAGRRLRAPNDSDRDETCGDGSRGLASGSRSRRVQSCIPTRPCSSRPCLRRKKPRRTPATRLPSRGSRREPTRPRRSSCRFPCANRSMPRRYAAQV